MRRRDLIIFLGTATTWPLATHAQQSARMSRVGVLSNGRKTDPEMAARLASFSKAFNDLGWIEGKNVEIDYRVGEDGDDIRRKAQELMALAPDVVLANAPPSVMALTRVSRTVPIVFAAVTDPVGLGIVQSLAHPGGHATGFLSAEFGFGAKWLELLKEVAPDVRRVGIVTDSSNRSGPAQFAAIQSVAPSFSVELRPFEVNDGAFKEDVSDWAQSGSAGLIALRIAEVITQRALIEKVAAEYRLPTIYPLRIFATSGGLISYGPDVVDQFARAAVYVDRILKGEKPADLPVQSPTKYSLVINLKTAKALGITVPPTLLARADEVIE